MFRSRIRVDLPSVETERSPSVGEWLRSLFGAQLSLRSGREELTVGVFSLIEGLIEGFARAGVDDVIAFLVDRQVVYCDQNEVAGDLPLIVRAAEVAGVLDRPFREMHLVLAHQDASLHTIIDCQIKSRVFLGDAEMSIDLSSRSSDLRVCAGETAEQYAERIRAFAAKPDSFEPGRRWVDALMRDIASSLQQVLVGARVSYETTVVKLIRPGVQQIGRFGNLRFGADVQAPQYRPIPTLQRTGAYADPFYYYYYDPYYDFMNYVLVDTLQRGSAWRSRAVQVMDPGGLPLFDADSVPSSVYGDYWLGRDAVSYDSRGGITLRPSQPTWSDNDRGTSWLSVPEGASHTSSSSSSSDSSSWSDRGSSCGSSSSSSDSSSSCGSSSSSSDSSSSCGSSCSSGSSCGSSCSSGSSCNSS